jgi:hypothetical protein
MEERNFNYLSYLSNRQVDNIIESYIRHYNVTGCLSKHFFVLLEEKLKRNEC